MAEFGAEFVKASSEVMHERVAADDDARRSVSLDSTHRPQPRFQRLFRPEVGVGCAGVIRG